MEMKELVNTTPLELLIENMGANKVFGEPTTENDVVIIPVAQVEFGFGFGGGYGEGGTKSEESEEAGEEQEEDGSAEASGAGGGGGGGAGGRAAPRGYIRITPEEVKYEPIQDEMRIPLAGIFMVAWSVFWVMATVRTIAKAVAKTKQSKR